MKLLFSMTLKLKEAASKSFLSGKLSSAEENTVALLGLKSVCLAVTRLAWHILIYVTLTSLQYLARKGVPTFVIEEN